MAFFFFLFFLNQASVAVNLLASEMKILHMLESFTLCSSPIHPFNRFSLSIVLCTHSFQNNMKRVNGNRTHCFSNAHCTHVVFMPVSISTVGRKHLFRTPNSSHIALCPAFSNHAEATEIHTPTSDVQCS